jgi:hypothetical protein
MAPIFERIKLKQGQGWLCADTVHESADEADHGIMRNLTFAVFHVHPNGGIPALSDNDKTRRQV